MPAPSEKGGRAVSWGAVLAVLLLPVAFGGLVYYFAPGEHTAKPSAGTEETHKNAEPDKEGSEIIPALGRIEPMDGVLSLGVATPDRILKMLVKEGQHVKSGDKLVELEGEALRNLEERSIEIQRQEAEKRRKALLASGKAQIQVEEVRLKQAKELGPLEIEAQQSKLDFLRVQAANAKKDYGRLERLGDTIAEQDKEKQRLLWRQAEEELSAADKQYKRLQEEQPLNVQMAEARRIAAQAELERGLSTISLDSLSNQVDQAKARREAARVTAPSDGTILRLLAHEGELVGGKPIIQMANIDKMIVVAEVSTSFIPRVREGDPATITSPVFNELNVKLEGEVYSIRAIVGKPQVANPDPLAPVDRRVMEVKIFLKQSKPADKYIGHEVDVSIRPRKRSDG
jgi:HlyD family secretion protein